MELGKKVEFLQQMMRDSDPDRIGVPEEVQPPRKRMRGSGTIRRKKRNVQTRRRKQ
jgi:hypothetical protein